MAEGLFRDRLRRAGVDARVHSAGLVTQGQPASEHSVTAMAHRDVDIAEHRSRRLSTHLVGDADLVVGMELQHVREVAVLDRNALDRSFTLPELARRVQAAGPRSDQEPVESYLRRVAAGRQISDLLGNRPEDEIADPIGRPMRDYEAAATQIETFVDVVVAHLFPDHGGTPCA